MTQDWILDYKPTTKKCQPSQATDQNGRHFKTGAGRESWSQARPHTLHCRQLLRQWTIHGAHGDHIDQSGSGYQHSPSFIQQLRVCACVCVCVCVCKCLPQHYTCYANWTTVERCETKIGNRERIPNVVVYIRLVLPDYRLWRCSYFRGVGYGKYNTHFVRTPTTTMMMFDNYTSWRNLGDTTHSPPVSFPGWGMESGNETTQISAFTDKNSC